MPHARGRCDSLHGSRCAQGECLTVHDELGLLDELATGEVVLLRLVGQEADVQRLQVLVHVEVRLLVGTALLALAGQVERTESGHLLYYSYSIIFFLKIPSCPLSSFPTFLLFPLFIWILQLFFISLPSVRGVFLDNVIYTKRIKLWHQLY